MEAKKEKTNQFELPVEEFDLFNSLQPSTGEEGNTGLEELFPQEKKENNDDFLLKLFNTDDQSKEKHKERAESPNQKIDPSQSLFSLDDLIGQAGRPSKDDDLLGFSSQEDILQENLISYEKTGHRPRVAPKNKTIEEEEIFSVAPEDNAVNSIPGSTYIKPFPNKTSIAETIKLDSTVTNLKESVLTPEIGSTVDQDNIHEGVSDDDDDELKQQWDEFMKESEEFGK